AAGAAYFGFSHLPVRFRWCGGLNLSAVPVFPYWSHGRRYRAPRQYTDIAGITDIDTHRAHLHAQRAIDTVAQLFLRFLVGFFFAALAARFATVVIVGNG